MAEIPERLVNALSDRYRLQRELGAGGMATVYLAEDVRHARKVAVKVLRPELAAILGGERFLKEIEVTANLQHPHILPLYDSGEADTFLFYVMPFVAGESLRDRMDREKQLSVDDAVEIGRAVAGALDYAHRHDVVHRDIKPENIMLSDGQALVADFGIALAVTQAGGSRLTETGLSLGTPHYMSPEQATGDRELDAKSDVYSLGCVVYEMLVGEPPHVGQSVQAVIAKVLSERPTPISRTRDLVPLNVDSAVQKALAKSPADRFASAARFAEALTNPGFTIPMLGAGEVTVSRQPGRGALLRRWGWAVPAVLLAALFVGVLRPSPPDRTVSRHYLTLPESSPPGGWELGMALTPDASQIVYVDGLPERQLWSRARDRLEPLPIAGTAGAIAPTVSPDGNSLAFVAALEVRRVPLVGGSEVTVADSAIVSWPQGVAWLEDESVYYVDTQFRLRRVSSSAGGSEIVFDTAGAIVVRPTALPEARGVLFTLCAAGCTPQDLWVYDAAAEEARVLVPGVARGWYLPTGHLLIARGDGAALAVPFDLGSLEVRGVPVPILDGVAVAAFAPVLAMSQSGTMVYLPGRTGGGANLATAVWVDRSGLITPLDSTWQVAVAGNAGWALSPDDTKLAIKAAVSGDQDIWVKELPSGPASRLTFDEREDIRPGWTADGTAVTFISSRGGNRDLWVKRADGVGQAELLVDLDLPVLEGSWSPDGDWIVLRTGGQAGARGARDLVGVRPGADSVPVDLVATTFDEKAARVSPNGRWLAYESNETGRDEVFVRPFPNTADGKWQVSTTGGTMPLWAHNGRELFFVSGSDEMTVATFESEPTFRVIDRRPLFTMDPTFVISLNYTAFDISADDERFLMMRSVRAADPSAAPIVVENWIEELRALVRD